MAKVRLILKLELGELKKLEDAVEELIAEALTRKEEFGKEAINWGDLHCTECKATLDERGGLGWYVLIEELDPSCPNFKRFIFEGLKKMGYENVDVILEW